MWMQVAAFVVPPFPAAFCWHFFHFSISLIRSSCLNLWETTTFDMMNERTFSLKLPYVTRPDRNTYSTATAPLSFNNKKSLLTLTENGFSICKTIYSPSTNTGVNTNAPSPTCAMQTDWLGDLHRFAWYRKCNAIFKRFSLILTFFFVRLQSDRECKQKMHFHLVHSTCQFMACNIFAVIVS